MLVLLIILCLIGHDIIYVADDRLDLSEILVDLHILQDCLAEVVTHFLQDRGVEVQIRILSKITPTK